MNLRTVGIAGAGLLCGVIALFGVATVGLASVLGGSLTSDVIPSGKAIATIPAGYLQLFEAAAATCPGLPWTVLAAIGKVESDFGQSTLPGVTSGTNAFGAAGPMQLGVGGAAGPTFYAYDHPVPADTAPNPAHGATPPSPYNPADAIFAAARDLCTNGAKDGADIHGAIYAYNHTAAYVQEVLSDAAEYETTPASSAVAGAPTTAAAIAISYALDQIGTPYVWGGETPGVGFDCSGLTQAAYAAAGIHIPRTSTAQWTTLPHVPLKDLEPGDLVFFDPGEFTPGLPGHVGIYLGNGEMVDAPHTGTDVQIDNLAGWPTPMGAARPSELAAGHTGSAE